MIELKGLRRMYGDRVAVQGLDLSIPAGEIFAFLGPNGAGKTTTIKMMVGLLRPTAGTVIMSGIDAAQQPHAANRLIGYVPDQPYLYDKLTGREFLRFVADLHGLPPQVALANIEEQVNRFELREFIDRLTEGYSHGMKQRMVFAAAFVHQPPIVIVDEPMVGLDPRSARLVKDLLRDKAAHGTTVFMSTHSLSMAEEIANRLGIIHKGRLEFLGTLVQLRDSLSSQGSLEELYLTLTQ